MVFSSAVFMFAFLPIFLAAYFVCPGRRTKNICLLLASLVFYAWGEPVYVLLMVCSIVANWALARAIGCCPAHGPVGVARRRRALLVVAVAVNVLVIGFFKYEGFVAQNVNALLGVEVVPDLELGLPIGISFYTLQALSYVVDVYRGDAAPQRNILYLGMYIACFPQLIAGPIVRYRTIEQQILGRRETLADFTSGLRLFLVGFAKKALLANTVAALADDLLALGGAQAGAVGAWCGLVAYAFQIYFDFSGYSDMAIGLGRMLGFRYLRNFNYPYISRSITEFWRRWHISLGSFFRDYVYIPLGGNRVSVPRHVLNMLIVWGITGLWHGAGWNFVAWGLYYGVLLVLEKHVWGRALARLPRVVQHGYALVIVLFGWMIFWIGDASAFVEWLAALFGAYGATGTQTLWELGAWEYWPIFVVCALASTPIAPFLKERLLAWAEGRAARSVVAEGVVNERCLAADSLCVLDAHPASPARARVVGVAAALGDVALVLLLMGGLASIISGSFNPFIYFQF